MTPWVASLRFPASLLGRHADIRECCRDDLMDERMKFDELEHTEIIWLWRIIVKELHEGSLCCKGQVAGIGFRDQGEEGGLAQCKPHDTLSK
jgi:hypothetical protein